VKLVRLAARGWLIVSLTALNVSQIAAHHYSSAFVVGTAISLVWFGNSRHAAHSDAPGARWAYALGAGLGTLTGMYLGTWGAT
jgi:hypothetical protein